MAPYERGLIRDNSGSVGGKSALDRHFSGARRSYVGTESSWWHTKNMTVPTSSLFT